MEREQGTATLEVALRSANLLKMWLVTTAAMLAICLLAVVETTNTAEATSLPHNGKIAFTKMVEEESTSASASASALASVPPTTVVPYIYVMNADGTDKIKLLDSPARDPAWSPDGKKIAFTRDDVIDEDIYVMNADGTEQKKLTDLSGGGATSPAWSPDGKKIAFSYATDLFIMDADGSSVRRIAGPEGYYRNPSWSPDGTKIAFDIQPGSVPEDTEIYTMNVDGTGVKALTNNKTPDHNPDWSPDGRRIVFEGSISVRKPSPTIEIMNADGGGKTTFTKGGSSADELAMNPT